MAFQLEEIIKEKLEEVDIQDIIETIVRELITRDLREKIDKTISEKFSSMAEQEIKNVLDGSFDINDGYGMKGHFENFEELFKKTFAEKMRGSYQIQGMVSRLVEEKVAKLFEQHRVAASLRIAEEITQSLK